MTDTLTLERTLAEVRRAANDWLPKALTLAPHELSSSSYRIQEEGTIPPQGYHSLPQWTAHSDKHQHYVIGSQSNMMLVATYTCMIRPLESKGFEGLAAILTSIQEPARNNWGSIVLVADEASPIPATSERFLPHVRETFAGTCVRSQLQEWAELACQVATDLLPADVEAPQKVADPENEAEWWLAIVAKCRGNVTTIMTAYDKLVERFVTEIPAEARDRIKFEILVDD